MSRVIGNEINQQKNTGTSVAINNGTINQTTNHYNSNEKTQSTPAQLAENEHKKTKQTWKKLQTCDWIMGKKEFQDWFNVQQGQHSVLWISGSPGHGKTTLMSRIIEYIREENKKQGSEPFHLLYFYISYGNDQVTGNLYRNLLLALWQQVAPSDFLLDTESNNEDLMDKIIEALAAAQRDVSIVIDALDQLPTDDRDYLQKGLEELHISLQHKDNCLRVAISSRNTPSHHDLEGYKLFDIRVHPDYNADGIRNYLERTLDNSFFRENEDLKTSSVKKLVEEGRGNFLWIHFQTKALLQAELKEDVHRILDDLLPSNDMNEYYKKCVNAFEMMGAADASKQVSNRALALLSHLSGLIPKDILLVAITLNLKNEKSREDYSDLVNEPHRLVSLCRHLIEFDEDLDAFKFYHVSVYQFFRNYKERERNNLIARLCLAHLCSLDFCGGAKDDARWYHYGELGRIMEEHPFLEFASLNWADSLKRSDDGKASSKQTSDQDSTNTKEDAGANENTDTLSLMKKLLGKNAEWAERKNLQLAFQIYLLASKKSMPKGVCQIHILSYFALDSYFFLCKETPLLPWAQRDDEGSASIHWVIRGRAETSDKVGTTEESRMIETIRVIETLIKPPHNDALNALDNEGRTPLHHAAHYGDLGMVKLLIERNAKLDIQSKRGETALIVACKLHHHKKMPSETKHHDIVPQLVAARANVQLESTLGTALQAICLSGCLDCTKGITSKYGEKVAKEKYGTYGTSLHCAAFHGHAAILDHLLKLGIFNVHQTDKVFGSVLTAAATGCNYSTEFENYYKIFDMLIDKGVNVDDNHGEFGPALRAAAAYGDTELVTKLLDAGACIKSACGPMGTAYQAADDADQEEIKALLKEKDQDADTYIGANKFGAADALRILRQQFFKHALEVSNFTFAHVLIDQFVQFYINHITKLKPNHLEMLARHGRNVFTDVIKLATKQSAKNRTATHVSKDSIRDEIEEDFDIKQPGPAVEEESPTMEEESPAVEEESPAVEQRLSIVGKDILVPREVNSTVEQEISVLVQEGSLASYLPEQKMLDTHQFPIATATPNIERGSDIPATHLKEENEDIELFHCILRFFCCLKRPQEESAGTSSRVADTDTEDLSRPKTEQDQITYDNSPGKTESPSLGLTKQTRTIPQDRPTDIFPVTSRPSTEYQQPLEIIISNQMSISSAAVTEPASNMRRFSRRLSHLDPSSRFSRVFSLRTDAYSFTDNYHDVLDHLTRAAVTILEHAIVANNQEVIRLISKEWVTALDDLVRYKGFGRIMLGKVVKNRMIEFKDHLKDYLAAKTEKEKEEAHKKAKDLAEVGVELLMTADRHGKVFRDLSFELSYLWTQAVNDVLDIGASGQEQLKILVQFFADKFTTAIRERDGLEATAIGRAWVGILRSAAMTQKRWFMDNLAKEWVNRWDEVIKGGMESITRVLIKERWKEYRRCMECGKYSEAVGLAVAGLELLRAAIREKLVRVVEALQPVIIEAIEWKPVYDTDKEPGKQEEYVPQQQFNLGSIFDAIIGLIAEADETKTASQDPLASAILTRMSTADDHSFKAITGILDQRVKVIKQKIKHQDPDHELQRNRMSTAMEYLLDRAKKPDMTFEQSFLEKVADSTTKLSSTKKGQDTTLDASKESGSAVVVDNSEN